MSTFAELGLSEQIVSSLTALGFEEPTPIQEKAIPALLAGHDVLGQAATGTGKTGAFSLPLLERYAINKEPGLPSILILTPTRELCLQVSESLHKFGRDAHIEVTPIYGGQEYGRQIRALKRGSHVVVATPGRALDHINKGTLDLSAIQAVVLDEADEMLDLGFADELEAIFDNIPEKVQTALFSATLPPRIARIAEDHLQEPVRIQIAREVTSEGNTPRVPQVAYVVGHNYRTTALGRILDLESPELTIIFARTRNEVDELTEALRVRGYLVEALHGGLDQPTRDRVMKRARNAQLDVIVATDVAARGIDLENLTHVINFGVPASYETYVHRIGRTGRAGRTGTAITILEPREHRHIKGLERFTHSKIEVRPVPSATDVQSKRLELLSAKLVDVLQAADYEKYRLVVETLCEDNDPMDVAAAALKLAQDASGTPEDAEEIPHFDQKTKRVHNSDRPRRTQNEPEPGMTRIFIGSGRQQGIRPGDIVGAIANEAGISSKVIGAIEIMDRFTIVEVRDETASQIVEAMQEVRFKGRTVTVKLDEGAARTSRVGFDKRSPRNERAHRSDRRRDRLEGFRDFKSRSPRR